MVKMGENLHLKDAIAYSLLRNLIGNGKGGGEFMRGDKVVD